MIALLVAVAFADETFVIDGEVTADGPDHVFVPFEVPAGVGELEVHLDDLSDATILDWGLDDPDGHRGWGGGNTEPAVLHAEAASRSYVPGPLGAGTWYVVVGKAKLTEDPAPYRITVTLRDAPTLAPQPERTPYVPSPPLASEARWYRGDLHVHSRESGDARPDLDAVAEAARAAGLDFVILSDHNVVTSGDWIADAQARHPDVLLVPGIEYTTYDGHANAPGATAWLDHRVGQPGVTASAAAADAVAQGALFSINHPTLELGETCIGCAWGHEVPTDTHAVEVANGGWEPVGALFTPSAIAFWEGLAAEGRRLAAVGGSDDHKAGEDLGAFDSPIGTPTTWVYATELSHAALLEGLRAQRTMVGLDGPDSPAVAWGSDGVAEGGDVVGSPQHLTLTVDGVADEVHWFVDGDEVAVQAIDGAGLDLSPTEVPQRVRAEVWRGGRPTVLTSHLWVRAARASTAPTETGGPPGTSATGEGAEPSGGCGCAAQGGAHPGPWALAALLLACKRRRRGGRPPIG